jgi:hypothetical protein
MSKLIRFLKDWNELMGIPIALLLWILSPWLIRMIDPTAGVYDAGIFQVIIFTLIQYFIYSAVAWLSFKLTFPEAYSQLDQMFLFDPSFKNDQLTKWQKSKLIFGFFALSFIALVLLSRTI